jgi:hypothetical protein
MVFRKYGTPVSEIGEITVVPGIRVLSPEGETVSPEASGYDHFKSRQEATGQ